LEILYLILGWLFGLLSPQIANRIDRGYRRAELLRTVVRELVDLQYRIAVGSLGLRQHLATVNQEYLTWLRPILRGYDGPDRNEPFIASIEGLAKLTDTELKALDATTREPGRTIRPGKFFLPFVTSQLHRLAICPLNFQERVLQVKLQLDFYNAEVDALASSHEKTFDPEIVGSNRDALLQNIIESQQAITRRSEQIATRISEIRLLYGRRARRALSGRGDR
jgi:hypothetical protein